MLRAYHKQNVDSVNVLCSPHYPCSNLCPTHLPYSSALTLASPILLFSRAHALFLAAALSQRVLASSAESAAAAAVCNRLGEGKRSEVMMLLLLLPLLIVMTKNDVKDKGDDVDYLDCVAPPAIHF